MGHRKSGKKAEETEKEAEGDDGFPMPEFDEKAFMRREMESARTTFWTIGLAVPLGVLAWAVSHFGGSWLYGILPAIAGMIALKPLFQKIGFSDDATAWKGLLGNFSLLFFTVLSIMILIESAVAG